MYVSFECVVRELCMEETRKTSEQRISQTIANWCYCQVKKCCDHSVGIK